MCKLLDIREQIKEARRLRDNTSVKINDYRKKGKDTSDLEKQLQGFRDRVNELTHLEKLEKEKQQAQLNQARTNNKNRPVQLVQIPAGEQKQLKEQATKAKVKPQTPKSWKKTELEACERTMNRILEDNDWHVGYQFRSSEWMFIKHLRTIVLPDSVELEYIIQYKTRNHRVEKTVTKYFNPQTIQSLNKYIEQVELWVMLNSGDMDNKDIPFGARFNQVQFEKQGFKEQGWIMYK